MRTIPLLLLLLLLLSPPLAAPGSAESEGLAAFDGNWLRLTEEDDEARLSSIDAALAELSWVTRSMAAPILRRTTVPPERYVFEVDADGIALGQRDRQPRPLVFDGSERQFEGDRGAVTTSAERREDAIETRWQTEQAHGSNTFRVEDGGTTLVVRSVLQITAISGVEAIRYETRFAKTLEAPAVGSPPR